MERVYVGNLPPDIRIKDIDDFFRPFGKLIYIDVNHRANPVYAYVQFDSPRNAFNAVKARHGYDYEGYTLQMRLVENEVRRRRDATPPPPPPPMFNDYGNNNNNNNRMGGNSSSSSFQTNSNQWSNNNNNSRSGGMDYNSNNRSNMQQQQQQNMASYSSGGRSNNNSNRSNMLQQYGNNNNSNNSSRSNMSQDNNWNNSNRNMMNYSNNNSNRYNMSQQQQQQNMNTMGYSNNANSNNWIVGNNDSWNNANNNGWNNGNNNGWNNGNNNNSWNNGNNSWNNGNNSWNANNSWSNANNNSWSGGNNNMNNMGWNSGNNANLDSGNNFNNNANSYVYNPNNDPYSKSGFEDKYTTGLSGSGRKWFNRYIRKGFSPEMARAKALEHRTVPYLREPTKNIPDPNDPTNAALETIGNTILSLLNTPGNVDNFNNANNMMAGNANWIGDNFQGPSTSNARGGANKPPTRNPISKESYLKSLNILRRNRDRRALRPQDRIARRFHSKIVSDYERFEKANATSAKPSPSKISNKTYAEMTVTLRKKKQQLLTSARRLERDPSKRSGADYRKRMKILINEHGFPEIEARSLAVHPMRKLDSLLAMKAECDKASSSSNKPSSSRFSTDVKKRPVKKNIKDRAYRNDINYLKMYETHKFSTISPRVRTALRLCLDRIHKHEKEANMPLTKTKFSRLLPKVDGKTGSAGKKRNDGGSKKTTTTKKTTKKDENKDDKKSNKTTAAVDDKEKKNENKQKKEEVSQHDEEVDNNEAGQDEEFEDADQEHNDEEETEQKEEEE